ncbi:hypothetical protein [Flavobacterium gyeonganense]|uniref:Pentapeptide repeat-containing protein n=1 Tax=Flavobacterium gyeonganense TaxID=1310418 RepID=A0ABV5HDQ3_9FLAO|nr:hypothetical protein [Flavobacterium gyeonganense]
MENLQAFDVIRLLEHTQLIITQTVYKTKLISDKKIEGRLVINIDNIKEPVTFSNCEFDDIFIHNASIVAIEFNNCTFTKDFDITYIKASSLRLYNCDFLKKFFIRNCKIDTLHLHKSESQNGINIEGGILRIIDIIPVNEKTQFSFIGKFLLIEFLAVQSTSGITLLADKAVINSIHINGYYNVSSRLNFNQIINERIELENLNNDGKIYFTHLKQAGVKGFLDLPLKKYLQAFNESNEAHQKEINFINEISAKHSTLELLMGYLPVFYFKDFIEKNFFTDFLSYKENISVKFLINNSSAGILELKNIKFEQYKLELLNSDLSAVKLINSHIPDVGVSDNYLNYYNVYNDLYTSAAKQNNTKDKIDYYRISQQYLYKYLRYESTAKKGHIGSRISITVSLLYSNHGTDWLKACLVTLVGSLFFFILFVYSLKDVELDPSLSGLRIFFKTYLLPFFPQFINPLHRIDFMNQTDVLGTWSSLVDFFSRIIVSIGIFEIIRSFRKHVRS